MLMVTNSFITDASSQSSRISVKVRFKLEPHAGGGGGAFMEVLVES